MNENIKKLMINSSYEIARKLLEEGEDFRIIIWTEDNWNKALPEIILNSFPVRMVLDIKDMTLDDSYLNENDEIVIKTFFEGEEYIKTILKRDIVAVLDIDGQPFIMNNFDKEIETILDYVDEDIVGEDDILEYVQMAGVDKKDAIRSINAFIKEK